MKVTYRVSHKKVYPFEANLVIIEFKSLAYVSHTIGQKTQFAVKFGHENRTWIRRKIFRLNSAVFSKTALISLFWCLLLLGTSDNHI